jgi:4-hydroxybenzoate polyprenyltransferase
VLLSFPLVTAAGVAASQRYLGLPFDWLPVATMAVAAFAIYAVNRFTDNTEDRTNDPSRASSRKSVQGLLLASVLAIGVLGREVGSRGPLALTYFAGILLIGAAYSMRLVPWYSRRGWRMTRFKDLLLLKNVVVALVWASAFFMASPLYVAAQVEIPPGYFVLGVGYFLMCFADVLFSDFRDEQGDRAAGICTLPVRFGVRRCYTGVAVLSCVWLTVALGLRVQGVIDTGHFVALLLFNAAYPATVYWVRERLQASREVVDYVIEGTGPLLVSCLVALS